MAITFPLSLPSTTGIAQVTLRAHNAVSTSQSPFTFKRQVIAHTGQAWSASVSVPRGDRSTHAEWTAFLTSLKAGVGTFLLGDPDYATPRGTVSACTLTGSAGDETVTVTMTGSLLAGDYIQLGSGTSAKLHKVLQDQTGDGSLEIWPALRSDYTSETVVFNNAKGVFALPNNVSEWSIVPSGNYDISFEAQEVITG